MNIVKGYLSKREFYIKTSWEQTRRVMGVTASVNWNTAKFGKFTLEKLLPFPWEDNIKDETDIQKIEIEVETNNKPFWAKYDAIMDKDKTDC